MKNSRSSLVGIRLVPDGFSALSSPLSSGTVIGCFSLPSDAATKSCKDFRPILVSKLTNLPKEFIFLTGKGWPISRIEEENITVSQLINSDIITIERDLGMPRLGIKRLNGESLGFIFIQYSTFLTEAREKIASELSEKIMDEGDFEFLDTNMWPILSDQEQKLTVWDVMSCNSLTVSPVTRKRKPDTVMHKPKKRPNRLNFSTDGREEANDKNDAKSILISYVHAEASTHARDLKNELINMGLKSVFLDVDDIPPGKDWQDIINSSLNNCAAFVPLVTPRYGETKWTNREAKLADDKEKLIIPVSFLQKWPPDQLAIQFVTLQYIPWKTGDDFATGAEDHHENDISLWEPRCVHRVAKEIKNIVIDQDVSTPDSSSILDPQANGNWIHSSMLSAERKKDFIVISAHCQQKDFVTNVKSHLELAGYNVWSSVEMCEYDGESFSSFDDSQQSEASPYNVLSADFFSRVSSPYNESAPNSQTDTVFSFKHENGGVNLKKFCTASSIQDQKRKFKMQVKLAKLVILIISEDYFKSRVCKQQAYYCGLRRKVIVVKLGTFPMENIISNMFVEEDMIKENEEKDLLSSIENQIMKKLQEDCSKNCTDYLACEVDKIRREIKSNFCVYVTGGTSVSFPTEAFCMILGSELAKIKNLTLVTEGSFGACDLVAKNFCEELDIKAKGKAHSIYHIIPYYDRVITNRARQLDDGTFEKLPYGKTIYCGKSLADRDNVVSTIFKICILIEGDDQSASLAEKFLWNDRIVIPVVCKSMEAVSSRQCLSESISKVPCWLVASNWDSLNSDDCTPEERAASVQKIILSLLKQQTKAKQAIQKRIK